MNFPAAVIATGLGAAFFAAEMTYFYQPSWFNADRVIGLVYSSDRSKARVAVSRLLIVPSSAEFGDLSEVEVNKTKFVCGAVSAKDKKGRYSGYRDFVYTVAIDAVGIDDDGRITHSHGSFSACPQAPQKKPDDPHKTIPDAAAMAKAIEKVVPQAVNAGLSAIASNVPTEMGSSSGGTLDQQVSQMANQMTGGPVAAKSAGSAGPAVSSNTSSSGQSSASNAKSEEENGWRSDRVPAAWPSYSSDDPLSLSTHKRTPAQAMALATSVEDRWKRSSQGRANERPTREEVQEACRALLSISPNDKAFPKAWSTFLRLRKIERELTS